MKIWLLALFVIITGIANAQSPSEQELLGTINKLAKKSIPRSATLVKKITFAMNGCTLQKNVTLRRNEEDWSRDYNIDTEDFEIDFYD